MQRDVSGTNGFGIAFSLNGESTSLAANVEQHITVPDNYPNWMAVFSYTPGSNIWVDGINTAVVPGTSFAASTARLNPAGRYVKAGDVISFITSDITVPWVDVEFQVVSPYGN